MERPSSRRYWQTLPRELADTLRPLVAGITDDVIAEIHAESPETARAGHNFELNLRAGIDAAYRQLLEEIGHPEISPQREIFEAFGRAQCRSGRGFDEMQAFYRLSAMVFWRRVGAAARRGELSMEAVLVTAEGTVAFIHELSVAAAKGYSDERARLEQSAQTGRQTLVRLVLQQPQPDQRILEAAADASGRTLPSRLAVVVLSGYQGQPISLPATIAALIESRLCLLVPDVELRSSLGRLETMRGDFDWAGVGPVVPIDEAAASYQRASALVDLAERGLISGPRLLRADDHLAELLVAGDPWLGEAVASRHLQALDQLHPRSRERMTQTLFAWLADPHRPQAMADAMQLHVQTVRYRIARLRELVGDAMDDPQGRFELAVALRARGMSPARRGGAQAP